MFVRAGGRRTVQAGVVGLVLAASLLPASENARSQSECPIEADPVYGGSVPTAKDVLGFRLGRREATTDEAWGYLDAVDAASDRVATGTYATSVQGRPLRYAVVGDPENVTPEGLEATRQAVLKIRDPATAADEVEALAASTPAFLYIAGNVHGSEESGTDAGLRILYELADRTDCAAQAILDDAVVFILPIQNPDGREADTRRNAYGFDMNRDWFARTQAETDGKVELLRRYPPLLFVDAHEFSYYRSFFAPNDDPVYHDVPDQVLSWVDDLYAPALADEFRRRDWGFFNYHGYDFFMPGYGDTVPADGFMAAGLTLEHDNEAPFELRVEKTRVEFWLLLSLAARNRSRLLEEQHDAYVEAVDEGRAGILEPNGLSNPSSRLIADVPDRRVRQYFLLEDDERAYELQLLVRRLQRMDVRVFRLDAPLEVPDYRAYAKAPRERTLPAGTYWIPMAQPQKHWIQLMLNEDTYVPVRRTYDITGWSSPLLMNLEGGSSGAELEPSASLVPPLDEPAWPLEPARRPEDRRPRVVERRLRVRGRGAAAVAVRHGLGPALRGPEARGCRGGRPGRDRRARRAVRRRTGRRAQARAEGRGGAHALGPGRGPVRRLQVRGRAARRPARPHERTLGGLAVPDRGHPHPCARRPLEPAVRGRGRERLGVVLRR